MTRAKELLILVGGTTKWWPAWRPTTASSGGTAGCGPVWPEAARKRRRTMALPQFLLNLLFPPRCPFCDRPVEAVVSAPCPHCLGERCLAGRRPGRGDGEAFARCVCAGWYREPLRASLRRFKLLRPAGLRPGLRPSAGPGRSKPAGDLRPHHLGPCLSEDPPPAGL